MTNESIIDISRGFFAEVVRPILEREFPAETSQTVFGVFGYGSEVLRMDDGFSRDHHWGLRINALMPDELFRARAETLMRTLSAHLPSTFRGYPLREGYTSWGGLELDSIETYLTRTIGIDHAPQNDQEWLGIPEEDIIHVVAGEVWHDAAGRFSAIRAALEAYYPEPVRLRRIAHWCRYYSGMGAYALKRAILRDNELYATITFARAIRLGVQLAFLLDRQYYPYDKWLLAFFERLPRMAARLGPIVAEAVRLATPWERKLALLDQMSDVLDAAMVEDGIIVPHPPFAGSASSGYRLMEHAYAELIQKLPAEVKTIVPVWDQVYWERFHSGYVDTLDMETWDRLLNLTVVDGP
jgi:Domain of unknown function (DUF4037)